MRRCASQPLVRRAAPTPSSSPRTKSVRASSGTGASDGELLGLADPVPVGVPLGVAVELVGTAPSGGDTAGVDVVEPAAGPAEPEEPVAADAPVSAVARGTPVLSSIPHLLRLPLPAPPRTVGGTPAPSGGLAQPAKSLILLVPAGWGDVEEFGDLGDGFAARPDVPGCGAGSWPWSAGGERRARRGGWLRCAGRTAPGRGRSRAGLVRWWGTGPWCRAGGSGRVGVRRGTRAGFAARG